MESLNLEAITTEKPKKEKAMSKDIDLSTLTIDQLHKVMDDARAKIEEQSKDETIKIIAEMLKGCTPEEVKAIKGVLTGENKIVSKTVQSSSAKPPKNPKPKANGEGWALIDGKATYNGKEAVELTTNKKGKTAVKVLNLKGAQPIIDNAPEAIKKILLTLPKN